MTEFERTLVESFNNYFDEKNLKAIAYRRKQHRFSSQVVDVLVDSMNPDFYLAIENKSLSTAKGASSLYFTQHFSETQIPRLTNFLRKSGRKGLLAVELKRGSGRRRKAFLIPWEKVEKKWGSDDPGFSLEEIKKFKELERKNGFYCNLENVFK